MNFASSWILMLTSYSHVQDCDIRQQLVLDCAFSLVILFYDASPSLSELPTASDWKCDCDT